MATKTYYTAAGDGAVRNYGFSGYASVRNAASGDVAYPTQITSDVGSYGITASTGASTSAVAIARHFFPFDTSADDIDVADVTAISLFLYVVSKEDDAPAEANSKLVLVANTQASNTTLVLADFSRVGAVNFGELDLGNVTVNAYNEFVLNAAGIAAFNGSGFTKYAIREGHDLTNTWPPSSWNKTWARSGADFAMSEDTSGTKDPYMVVTYSAASPAARAAREGVVMMM